MYNNGRKSWRRGLGLFQFHTPRFFPDFSLVFLVLQLDYLDVNEKIIQMEAFWFYADLLKTPFTNMFKQKAF